MAGKSLTEQNATTGLTTEQAMNRVLEAEAAAQQHINDATSEAEHLLEQARQKARRIQERTDSRIARVHQRCNRWVAEEVIRIQQSESAISSVKQGMEQVELDDEVSDAVVRQLAEMLTTGK